MIAHLEVCGLFCIVAYYCAMLYLVAALAPHVPPSLLLLLMPPCRRMLMHACMHGHVQPQGRAERRCSRNHTLHPHTLFTQAEAAYCKAALADTEELQGRLYKEMRGRIQEADQSAPLRQGWLRGGGMHGNPERAWNALAAPAAGSGCVRALSTAPTLSALYRPVLAAGSSSTSITPAPWRASSMRCTAGGRCLRARRSPARRM